MTDTGAGVDPGDSASDAEVIQAVLAGDVDRYAVLVRRYRDRYARFATRVLGSVDAAEDAVQDAFIRAFDQLSQCRQPEHYAGWFFLILRNRCFAEQRRVGRQTSLEDAAEGLASETANRADGGVENAELRRAVRTALMSLTPEQREVFVLKHVEQASYEEIAARTGATVPSLKMRMHRAYDRLRGLLREYWT